ncbi:hypothetical protein VNO77_44606 [Canavalia gladiata]|uniref:Uncharacterized protein n=1 Tax=Canavalia gladiata TaxID=3824 RepID=A0AAN9K000_CANGL
MVEVVSKMLREGIEGRTLGSQTKYRTLGSQTKYLTTGILSFYSNRLLQGKQQRLVQKKAKTERCPILARNTKFLDEDLVIAFISQIMTIGVGGGNHQLPQTPVLCHVQALFIGLQHVTAESQDQTAVASIACAHHKIYQKLSWRKESSGHEIDCCRNESLLLPFQCCWYELCSWLEEFLSSSTVMEKPEKKRDQDLEEEWLWLATLESKKRDPDQCSRP